MARPPDAGNGPADDPRPVAPEKPLPSDCCEGGCDSCVFTVYAEELAHYEQALAEWKDRQAGGGDCVFCAIARGESPADIVAEDALAMAFVDLRQWHPGHVLVVPRQHLADVRDLDGPTGAALMAMLVRVTRAVSAAYPSEGLSVWHSIGPAAFQEVPHLHVHVHPRHMGDGLLRGYPEAPVDADAAVRAEVSRRVRAALQRM